MTKSIEKLITKLTEEISLKCISFLIDNLNEQESTNYVITLIISSHVSSLIRTLRTIAPQTNINDQNTIDNLCIEILESFNKLQGINTVRPITDNAIN
jgi:hypothetical protein